MNIRIGKGKFHEGQVRIISSKSDIHRTMLAAALADDETLLFMEGWSEDLEATARCIDALGGEVAREISGTMVVPIERDLTNEVLLNCGESGSTLRFLLPVTGALGRSAILEGKGRLPERPIKILLEELEQHGCTVEGERLPVALNGKLVSGTYTLPGNISSQFITGLLFALPLLEGNSQIRLTTDIESKGYVDMTLRTLDKFGVKVEEIETGYQVYGGQKYRTPRMVPVEGDWSNAAFWLAAGAMQGRIACQGLDVNSAQGDKVIMEVLERFGTEIKVVMNQITAVKKELKGIHIDASQIPDLVPILCVVAAAAEGRTEIFNAGRLRLKESDRLAVMAECLKKIGVQVEEHPEGLTIIGGCTPPEEPVTIDAHGDHRIVMAMAIAAVSLGVELIIEGAEAVQKSYPSFFAEFTKLGGVADVL